MKKIGASLFFAAALSAGFAQTNQAASRSMTLQDCFAAALKNNFDVRIERYNPAISQFNLSAAYGGYDPTFSFQGTHGYNKSGGYFNGNQLILPTEQGNNTFTPDLSGGTPWGMTYDVFASLSQYHVSKDFSTNSFTFPDSSSGQAGVTLTQPLLKNFWIDNNRLQILVAKNQLKYSEQGLRNQIITTVTAVENAYYELIYSRENVKVQEEALNLARTQLDQDRQRVQVGSLAPLDVQQDEAQVAQSRANLIAAQNNLSVAQNTLKNLLTDDYSQWHDVAIEPTEKLEAVRQLFDLQDSWSKGMEERPDLQQAKLNVARQGIQLKYYRNQLFPEVDLLGTYGFNGSGNEYNDSLNQINDGSRPFYSYGGRITIPLSNISARNHLNAGKATEKQLLLQLKQLEQNVMVQIDNAVKSAQSAWETVDATKQARIYAEAALDAEQKKYAVGKSTTFTVLQLQNNLTSARSQEIRALANYNEALANLAAAEGSTLERDNLAIEAK
ncbi:MAG TPA: TolC family protein [Candidatus Binatia bacterium]|nr:TolC family protein [Candidatus Binatia bacterium]